MIGGEAGIPPDSPIVRPPIIAPASMDTPVALPEPIAAAPPPVSSYAPAAAPVAPWKLGHRGHAPGHNPVPAHPHPARRRHMGIGPGRAVRR